MPAACIDLRSQTFRRTARGFDPGDVQAFLDLIASDYADAHAERERMRQAVAALSGELEAMRQTERTLMRMLSGAARAAEDQTMAAHADAERVLAEAHARAGALLAAHDDWCRRADAEIASMRRKQERAVEALTALIGEIERDEIPDVPPAQPSTAPQAVVTATGQDEGAGPSTLTTPAPTDFPSMVSEVALVEPELSEAAKPVLPTSLTWDSEPGPAELRPTRRLDEPFDDQEFQALAEAAVFDAARPVGPERVTGDSEPGWAELPPTRRLDEPFDDQEFEKLEVPVRRRRLFRWGSVGAVLALTTCVAVLAWPGTGDAPATVTPAQESDAPALAAVIPEDPPAEPVPTDPLVVRLAAVRECWVRLIVDGRPESRLLTPGDHVTKGAKRAIDLRVGDAAALSVTVNGRDLGPLGRDGQVVDRRFEATAGSGPDAAVRN